MGRLNEKTSSHVFLCNLPKNSSLFCASSLFVFGKNMSFQLGGNLPTRKQFDDVDQIPVRSLRCGVFFRVCSKRGASMPTHVKCLSERITPEESKGFFCPELQFRWREDKKALSAAESQSVLDSIMSKCSWPHHWSQKERNRISKRKSLSAKVNHQTSCCFGLPLVHTIQLSCCFLCGVSQRHPLLWHPGCLSLTPAMAGCAFSVSEVTFLGRASHLGCRMPKAISFVPKSILCSFCSCQWNSAGGG